MFDTLKALYRVRTLIKLLASVDNSLKSLAEVEHLRLKLELIKANILYDDLKAAEIGVDEENEPSMLTQDDSELAKVSTLFDQYKEVMGREPASEDSMDYIAKVAAKLPD